MQKATLFIAASLVLPPSGVSTKFKCTLITSFDQQKAVLQLGLCRLESLI